MSCGSRRAEGVYSNAVVPLDSQVATESPLIVGEYSIATVAVGPTRGIATVPVAVHCLYTLGFETFNLRVIVHSIAGCMFFGTFTVKMLALTRKGLPNWVLPVFGGLAFELLTVIWFTSAFWFFSIFGFRR